MRIETSRNWGFISPQNQTKLSAATVAIAGVGGVGGRIAVELARIGVGHLILADPDFFSPTNLNRQEGSFTSTLGKNKATVLAEICKDINPGITIAVYPEGINENNLEQFSKNVDIIVEATDYTLPHLGVMLARAARQKNIPMITGVEMGYGATLCWFSPVGQTYEQHLGLKRDVSLRQLANGEIKVNIARWITHIPNYGDIRVLQKVVRGEEEAPAISPAVGLCSAMASTQIVALLSGTKSMPPAPAIYSVDVKELKSRIIRFPKIHFQLSLLRVIAVSFFKK